MTSPLSDLTYLICSGEFISGQTISDCLEAEYDCSLPLQEGVERLLCEHGFHQAIDQLFDSSKGLLKLVQFIDPSYTRSTSKADLIQILLQKLNLAVPVQARWSLGPHSAAEKIQRARREFEELVNTGRVDREIVRRKPLDGWAYAEHVLKSTINFYTSAAFFTGTSSLVDDVFGEARKKKSLGPMFEAMRDIEKLFRPGPYKQKRQNKQKKQIPHDPHDLIKQCQRLFGRRSPFAGFDFWGQLKYRNFFAHSLAEIIDTANLKLFKNSLEAALKLVETLIELNIAPSVIYITAHGWDEYGRGTVWFVDERYVTMNSAERYRKELRMFKPAPSEFEKLRPYMTVTWPKDQMFDPPLAPHHVEGGMPPDETV